MPAGEECDDPVLLAKLLAERFQGMPRWNVNPKPFRTMGALRAERGRKARLS